MDGGAVYLFYPEWVQPLKWTLAGITAKVEGAANEDVVLLAEPGAAGAGISGVTFLAWNQADRRSANATSRRVSRSADVAATVRVLAACDALGAACSSGVHAPSGDDRNECRRDAGQQRPSTPRQRQTFRELVELASLHSILRNIAYTGQSLDDRRQFPETQYPLEISLGQAGPSGSDVDGVVT